MKIYIFALSILFMDEALMWNFTTIHIRRSRLNSLEKEKNITDLFLYEKNSFYVNWKTNQQNKT